MSEFQRAYDLLRGYVNREWDRMRRIDLDQAWEELNSPGPASPAPPSPPAPVDPEQASPEDRARLARQILGVPEDASFEAVRHAFRKLSRRSDPGGFAEGSAEAAQAAQIQRRVHWAYRVLTEGASDTEKRFRSLEID